MLSDTCTYDGCGQEVRFGTRDGRTGWHHREAVEHNARFGVPSVHPLESLRMKAEWVAANTEHIAKPEEDDKPEIPTTVEVPAVRLDDDDERMPSATLKLIRKARKAGWEAVATYSRGPWMHTIHWTPTGTSDLVVLRLTRGPHHARAMWRRSTKPEWKFEHGWTWTDGPPSLEQVNATALAAFINQEES